MGDATILQVTGGSGGMSATYERVRALAATYDATGNELRDWAWLGARTMADGDLVESALLAPVTFAEAEATVLAATTGPDGLVVESVGWETDALLVRAAVAALEATDRLVHDGFERLDYAVGFVLGMALRDGAALLVPAGTSLALGLALLPDGVEDEVVDGATSSLEQLLTGHPELLQHLVNGSGGLLNGLGVGPFAPTTEAGAGILAGLYHDGHPSVTSLDIDVPGSSAQPTSVQDLVSHLGDVAGLSTDPDSPLNGTLQVQTLVGDDGRPHHIVYLPGTDDLTTTPWSQDGDVRDMGTNFNLVNGADNAYQQGILQAMHDAGIGPDDPVLLAGHSMGGMEAAAILSQGSDFNVTGIVTAGSPTAQVDGFPEGSHVLSLEQHGDVVPLLDGEDNPDTPQQVTVQFDASPEGGIRDHHLYGTYVAGAAAVDASEDPSVVDAVQALHDGGYLGSDATEVSSQVFQIVRVP